MKAFFWALFFAPVLVFSEALPEVKIKPQWLQCAADTDCTILRDACRSCGEPIALNKHFIEDYLKVDYAQRAAAGLMLSCEACSLLHVKVSCENQQCKATRP